jgi:hypothetical protein
MKIMKKIFQNNHIGSLSKEKSETVLKTISISENLYHYLKLI